MIGLTKLAAITAASVTLFLQDGCSANPTHIDRSAAMNPNGDLTLAARAFPHKAFILDMNDHAFYVVVTMFPGLFADDRDIVAAMESARPGDDYSKASHDVFATFAPPTRRGEAWKPFRVSRFAPRSVPSHFATLKGYWTADESMGSIKYDLASDAMTRSDCQILERYTDDVATDRAVPVLLDLHVVAGEASVVEVRPVLRGHTVARDTCA